MEPLTRTQLQNARATAVAEKERIARKAEEDKGWRAAQVFYQEVRRTAEFGAMTYACSSSMSLGIAFDTMLSLTRENFPDCDVSVEIRHMAHDPTYGIRVSWTPPPYADAATTLEERRLQKETSW